MTAIVLPFRPVWTVVVDLDFGRWRVTVRQHGRIKRSFYRSTREAAERTAERIRRLDGIPVSRPIPQACNRRTG